MAKFLDKAFMLTLGALSETPLGQVAYKMMRSQPIAPKKLLLFPELRPHNTQELHLTAHRGLSGIHPENTAVSFEAGGKAGFYALECDTHCAADGTWMVVHDPEISTLFGAKGDVKSYTYDELMKIDMVKGANVEKYPHTHMCTLQEYIDICKTYNCRPMIEIKDKRLDKMQDLYRLLEKNDIVGSCILISFHYDVLVQMYNINPQLELWHLINNISQKKIDEAKQYGFGIAFCAAYNADRPEMIKKIHEAGLTAACWTVDSKELLDKMMDAGVKYITSNTILPTQEAYDLFTKAK